jgi:hypothetical protein
MWRLSLKALDAIGEIGDGAQAGDHDLKRVANSTLARSTRPACVFATKSLLRLVFQFARTGAPVSRC